MARQRKPPKHTVRIEFDTRLPFVKIAKGLASEGIVIRSNPETLVLYAVEDDIKTPATVTPIREVNP